MKSYIIDTSFALSYFNSDDSNHDKAVSLSSSITIGEDEVFISDFIYAEILTVTNRKKPGTLYPYIQKFINLVQIDFLRSNLKEYLNYYTQFTTQLSVEDVSLVYDALKYDLVILSFDKKLLTFAQSQGYTHGYLLNDFL